MSYKVNTATFTNSRLPKGYTIFRNSFDEYVVCDDRNRVSQVDNGIEKYNVRASYNKEVAIEHFLNNRISNGICE